VKILNITKVFIWDIYNFIRLPFDKQKKFCKGHRLFVDQPELLMRELLYADLIFNLGKEARTF